MDYLVHTENGDIDIEVSAKNFGDSIVDALVARRKELRMTQQDIAERTGINRANISRFEIKKHTPSLEVLTKYAVCLGMHLEFDLVENK